MIYEYIYIYIYIYILLTNNLLVAFEHDITFVFSKSTKETLEKGVKKCLKLAIKTPELRH